MRLLDDELTRLLEAERPALDSEFARELDEWAAAGFPRAERPLAAREKPWFSKLRDRIQTTPPRRLLAPAGALATLGVVVAVAVTQLADNGTTIEEPAVLQTTATPELAAPQSPNAAGAPSTARGGAVTDQAVPQPAPPVEGSGAGAGAQAFTPGQPRKIAQDVDLALSTQPDDLRDVADGVLRVTDSHHGLVVSSNVATSDPANGQAGGRATFELRIPAGELQAALSDLSGLAHVSSRTDGSVDITGRFKSADRQIEALTKERDRLLGELENAQSDTRKQVLHSKLNSVRAQLHQAQAALARAQQRVRLVPVSVTVTGDEAAPSDGGWSFSDALHDAGDVLTTAAGVLVIAAAVLVPLTLLVILAALAWRLIVRRSRERALDA